MEPKELKKVINDWPNVLRLATDPWAQEFAAKVWAQSGNPNWRPSLPQSRVMRKMVSQLPKKGEGEEVILIE